MTIPKGAKIKGISMDKIIATFEDYGFDVIGLEEAVAAANADAAAGQGVGSTENTSNDAGAPAGSQDNAGTSDAADKADAAGKTQRSEEERQELLKSMIKRVGDGESMEKVRDDFVKEFESVSVHEIANAEQGLIADGMEVGEVQKLCDLHSALFHGRTEEEIWEEEAAAAAAASKKQVPEGHPVESLRRENVELEKLLNEAESLNISGRDPDALMEDLQKIKKIRTLYGKKEELIMPLLARYGYTGPSDVMWGVDDEIKAEASRLAGECYTEKAMDFRKDIAALLERMKEMIYKEEKILFPLALENFTDEEWEKIYRDLPEMGCVYVDSYAKWPQGEEYIRKAQEEEKKRLQEVEGGKIRLEGGELTVAQLQAILKLLPIDLTFIDEHETNRFFSNQGKVFARPLSALGRPMYECHPQRVIPIVKNMLAEFKAGKEDRMEIWTPNPAKPVRVVYAAVRDEDGKYLGTLEMVQTFEGIKEHLK